jgi:LPS export ABC transporter protein LptC
LHEQESDIFIHKAGFWLGIAIAILFFSFLSYSLLKGNATSGIIPAGDVSMGNVDQRIQDLSLISLEGEKEDLRVHAAVAEMRSLDARLYLQEVEIRKESRDMLPLTVRGQYGVMDTDTRNVRILGTEQPVVLTLGDQYRIETPQLDWIEGEQEIHTNEEILFWGPDIEIKGKGFAGNIAKGEFEILQSVVAVLRE